VNDFVALTELASDAARQAGALLLERQPERRLDVETKSSPTDMVTEMDRASEDLIRSLISAARPHDSILGEEEGAAAGSSAVHWIVDPLDGTTNYLYGFPAWSVSIAAETGGQVVSGAVFDPLRNELFCATLGRGATGNGQPISVTAKTDLATALVGTGFAYDVEARREQGRWVAYLLPRVRDIRRAGSAALDLCWVADGRLDAYYEQGTHVWDRAAGALVVTEAGGVVCGFDGGVPSDESGTMAAAPGLAGPLQRLLAEARQ
jgi:myo-inositol-1(or 4)-monophosphatase